MKPGVGVDVGVGITVLSVSSNGSCGVKLAKVGEGEDDLEVFQYPLTDRAG